MRCRHCNAPLEHLFLDLGSAPPSNAYLSDADLQQPELYFPLRVRVCERCWLVQTEDYARSDELFRHDYAYFSSVSRSWLEHAEAYCSLVRGKLSLNSHSFVIEVAANDGYLLKNFVAAGIPCLGIEPTKGTADAAEARGVPVVREFFGLALAKQLARDGRQADLIVGNNVYAHVPEINDFTAGLKAALKPGGTITLEFPHLQRLLSQSQFDTVYHEHFSYLSATAVARIFAMHGLRIFDIDALPTHGGSLRVYGCHAEDTRESRDSVHEVLQAEAEAGLLSLTRYEHFQSEVNRVKDDLVRFLLEQKRAGKRVMAYGAAAKGNTLLNYAGIRPDLLPAVFDAAPSKQGKYLPGSHVPILHPNEIPKLRPDYLLMLPWNIADEIMEQQAVIRSWGGQFVRAVPTLAVLP